MNEKAIQYIEKLIPDIGGRSMNDPAYLVSAARVAADIEAARNLAELPRSPDHAVWWQDRELEGCMKAAIKDAAYKAGWSDVIFKGGQIIFIAEIKIVK